MNSIHSIRRHGFSLLEVLVATTLVTGVLALVAMFLRTIHSAERDLRTEVLLQRSVAQLAPQLRTDIRQAAHAELAGDKLGELRLSRNKDIEAVTYRFGDQQIERVTDNPASRRREAYPLPGTWQSRWALDAESVRLVLKLKTQRNNRLASPLQHLEIAASLGRDNAKTVYDHRPGRASHSDSAPVEETNRDLSP